MRNIFRLFLGLVMATVLYSCSDRLDDYYTAEELAGLKVHIQLPDYSRALVKTRALDKDVESISSVTVIAYNSDGGFISQQTKTPVDGVITPSLPSGTATVAVVANYDHTFTEQETTTLASTFVSSTPDASKPICWGTASVNDLLTSSSPEISLLRMTAKVTVVNNASGFTLQGFKMCNTADKGTIAPADGKGDAYTTLVNDTRSFTTSTGDYSATSPLVFYETPSSVGSYLIVKGTYNEKDYYYKVKMYKDQEKSNDVIDLLRNHNYIVTIKRVNDKGYSTPELAAANEAENRMSVTVIDDNPPIVDIISCKDYELGVCDTLNFLGTGDAIDENGNTKDKDGNPVTLNITVATSYKINNAFTYDISTKDSWITVDNSKAEMTTFASDGSNGSAGSESNRGAKFVIPVTVSANPTESKRDGTVTVTAGDLTRTIIIKQAGYDFLGDDNRKVLFFIDGKQQSDDYFGDFLPKVQGVSAAANQGLARDHGLHFAAVNGNTYSYKIPHLTGDKQLTKNDSRISIKDGGEGKDYIVTLVNSDNDDLWVSLSAFKITNKDNVTITYPVYHTGVLHNITDDIAKEWELGTEKEKRTGWFYYGVVEVKGTSGSIYHLLDRNIGASSNGFYSPATQETKENEGAKGAYMILTNKAQKEDNISDGKGITIYCQASSAPYLYVWKGINTELNGAYPGKQMSAKKTIGGTTYYYQTFNESSINILFNNGKQKTEDIKDITASSFYSYDNNTGYKKIIFPDVPNIGDSYMPFSSYFKVPTESYVDDILPKEVETRHTKTGEAYYCYAIPTTRASELQPKYVYLPVTGYYEGTSFRNENHANIWTSTRLSGFQGFSVSSPEFGFWFRYLDCHTTIKEISNMRIVGGSAGNYGGHIYTGMPVRGIHKI